MNNVTMICRDVYLRIGDEPVQHFRAWDVAAFVASMQAQEQLYPPAERRVITVATFAEYRADNWKGTAA